MRARLIVACCLQVLGGRERREEEDAHGLAKKRDASPVKSHPLDDSELEGDGEEEVVQQVAAKVAASEIQAEGEEDGSTGGKARRRNNRRAA